MPAQHVFRGQDDYSNTSSHPHERASLSSPPSSPQLFHHPTQTLPPRSRIDNPPLLDEESPLAPSSREGIESTVTYSYTRPSPGLLYDPRYAAVAHSYYPDPTAPTSQHIQNQPRFPIGSQQYHYDNYGRPLGHYPDDRPLIHFVTNEWRHQPKHHDYSSDYSEDEFGHYTHDKRGLIPQEVINYLTSLRVPRRVQRWLVICLLFFAVSWFGWIYWIAPAMEEERRLDD